MFHDVACNGLHVFVLKIPPEPLVEFAQPHLTTQEHPAVRGLLHAGLPGFEGVVQFTKYFFHHIFQGHQASQSPMLVNNQSHLSMALLESANQLIERHHLWNKQGFPHERTKVLGR